MSVFVDTALGLFESAAYKVNTAEPFMYASNKIGPIYVDCRMLQQNPFRWGQAVENMQRLIWEKVGLPQISYISGGETADLPFSIRVAAALEKPHTIIRKEVKSYGAKNNFAGPVPKQGEHVVHVADLMTDGKSAEQWVQVLRGAGATVEHYFYVFDRLQGGQERLKKLGVTAHPLCWMDADFFEKVGVEKGYIKQESYDSVKEYLADAANWAHAYLRQHPEFVVNNTQIKEGVIGERKGLDVLVSAYPELGREIGARVIDLLRKKGVQQIPEDLEKLAA